MQFVVQEHHARTHHFDFRLEREGVFKSWAVPKGVPATVGIRRLAVQVEDHDISFGDFEGVIPEGQYGAGQIRVWDRGTYVCVQWTDERIEVVLSGKRLKGAYVLARFHAGGKGAWLIQKKQEERATEHR